MKNLIPSAEMIAAAKNVIECRAIVQSIKPKVEKIQSEILAAIGAKDEEGQPITDPKLSYMIAENFAEDFYSSLDREYKNAGFEVEPGYCPLLVAEDMERKAVRRMNKVAESLYPGVSLNSSEIYNLSHLEKLTNLNLAYISQFIKK
jgi:hypothetical protein